jgi:hypothetical protein
MGFSGTTVTERRRIERFESDARAVRSLDTAEAHSGAA